MVHKHFQAYGPRRPLDGDGCPCCDSYARLSNGLGAYPGGDDDLRILHASSISRFRSWKTVTNRAAWLPIRASPGEREREPRSGADAVDKVRAVERRARPARHVGARAEPPTVRSRLPLRSGPSSSIRRQMSRTSAATPWSIAFISSGLFRVTICYVRGVSTSNTVWVYGMSLLLSRLQPILARCAGGEACDRCGPDCPEPRTSCGCSRR